MQSPRLIPICFAALAALLLTGPIAAEDLRLVHDAEPNDAPHQAVPIPLPAARQTIRVLGDLEAEDQDAYRLVIDEDAAGRRFDLQLTGRGGALTRLDVFDFTAQADGRGRIPEALEQRPISILGLVTRDGLRPARADSVMFGPGIHVLGVSHSGGSGAYTLELSARDATAVRVLDALPSEEAMVELRPGRVGVFWTVAGEAWFAFEISDKQAAEGAAWSLEHQAELGQEARLALFGPDGALLLEMDSANGTVVRRNGLVLAAGKYRLRSIVRGDGIRRIALEAGAPQPIDGREVEPNDKVSAPIEFGAALLGRIEGSDRDQFEFMIDADNAGRRFDLELETAPETQYEFCLLQSESGLRQCSRGVDGRSALRDLVLSAGRYELHWYDRKRADSDWELTWVVGEPVGAGEEAEPNDDHIHASALHERGFGRGRFVGAETDHWRFSVSGEPQLWRIQLQGDNLHELYLKDSRGATIAKLRSSGAERIRLDNQFLLPGEYIVAAVGKGDGDYAIRLQPLGPPPPGMEMEPNDSPADAGRLEFGVDAMGTLAERGDSDLWRFELTGTERVRITVTPPVDGSIHGYLGVGDEATALSEINQSDAELVWARELPAGDYLVSLKPRQPSDAEYRVRIERLDVLRPPPDAEPNDSHQQASAWPADGVVVGQVGHLRGDADWYEIPPQPQPVELQIVEQSGLRLALRTDGEPVPEPKQNLLQRANGQLTARLEADTRYWLEVGGSGDYRIEIPALARTAEAAARVDPQLQWTLERTEVQAFSPWGQALTAQLHVTNPALQARQLELQLHLTDQRWHVAAVPGSIALGPGESHTLEFDIRIPVDVLSSLPVQLSARAADPLGEGSAITQIGARAEAAAVRPSFFWAVPEALRGGFNMASPRFGGAPVPSPNMDDRAMQNIHLLFDGLARHGRWTGFTMAVRSSSDPTEWPQPTVRLGGEDLVPVRGFLLNPTSTFQTERYLAEFAVDLSVDGETWSEVLDARLEPLALEQAFVLGAPVSARYARLRPLATAKGPPDTNGRITLGEFKVVAEPGWRPDSDARNLADPESGGHLVRSDPFIRGNAFDKQLLSFDGKAPSLRLDGRGEAEVVLGFEHARAARIERIRIEPDAAATPGIPKRVRLSVAELSPSGPWRSVDEADLDNGAAGIDLAEPVWARYLRLQFEVDEGERNIKLPDRIAVFEAAGESVLGEWGHLASVGPWEHQHPPIWRGLDGAPENNRPETAHALEAGSPAPGRALLGKYSAHYRLQVPADTNRLRLKLRGWPTLEANARLLDAAGVELRLHRTGLQDQAEQAYFEALVEPGSSLRLEVYEPPRSLIVAWDTSGSVGAWIPTIQRALRAYAEQIRPGMDEVNLLPFGLRAPLLADWQGHPWPLMRMMAGGMRLTDSSAAEASLAVAARAMVGRPGKKGVILLTDAATNTDASLWPALDAGRPQVFALKLSSEGALGSNPAEEIDLMQDWAMVRGGHFDYVTGFASLARGYERASARMRRPVDFEVEAKFDFVADPDPARLRVVSGELAPAARGAVEIILDASGSMLKRIDGQRRIEIARNAIHQAVEQTLPEGLPLALRVYGHREAGSCRTDLEIPLAPLDKSLFLERVDAVQAINLARTPIADSLAAVASDLVGVEGRKLVVLLTDGEETCDGDPAAVIAKLAEDGVDVRINIVGFALDDDAVKRQFAEWAELGGGMYLDAAEADALNAALEQSLRLPFTVLDANGEAVGTGLVDGQNIELAPGRYMLRIDTAVPWRLEDIELAPGAEIEVKLD